MRKGGFTEERIIKVRRDVGERSVPQARHQRRHILQVAVGLWRDGDLGRPQAESAGRREPQLKKLLAETMLDASTLKEMLGKTSDARFTETSCDLGDRSEGLLAAAGLQAGRPAAEDLSQYLEAAGRWRIAGAAEGIGFATAPLPLPSPGAAIGSARGPGQSEEAVPCVNVVAANEHWAPGHR